MRNDVGSGGSYKFQFSRSKIKNGVKRKRVTKTMQNKARKQGGKNHLKRGQINIKKKDGRNKHNKHKWVKLSCW